jgi:hypothetical protein
MSDRASASAERLKQRRLDLQTRSQKNVSDFKDRTSAATKRISAADAKRKESSDADKAKQKKAADAHRERIAKKYSDIRARRQKAAERKQMKDEIKSELSKKETDVSEADDYNQRDKELKKTSKARKQRFKGLHTATNTDSNVDVNEGRVARAVRDTIDKLPQGRPGGKRDKIRQAAVNAEIRDKKSKEKGTTTYQQWSDAVNASKKRNKS